jgi:preprotein translocase subunit SecA
VSSHSEAALAFRPGVVQGAYPERRDERPPVLSRVRRTVLGALSVPQRASRARVSALVGRVDSEGAGLDDLGDARFDQAVAELRDALRREGLRESLLPRGFALVREAARRTLGTTHFDVQLFGGWVMAQSGLAELETGEGKTLAATLPASVAALAGIPVHVITANDYLVERDAEAMGPVYARLGLTVGSVVEREQSRQARRAAYACDVTYVTNKQVAFDYLRDRLEGAGDRHLAHELGLDGGDGGVVLRGLCFAIIDEADSVLIDDARTPLILSRQGTPADEPSVRTALWLARSLEVETHYHLDPRRAQVELTREGHAHLEELARSLAGPLAGPQRREEWVKRALSAEHFFERDRHYLVRDGAVQIIDLPTGRRAPDRSFEGGIHSLIEAKEGLPLTPQRETVARISYQRFFRRYLRLAGMTGTAREVARELWNIYGLRTVTVPTRLPSHRLGLDMRVFPTADAKWTGVVERIRGLHGAGRPVLVGTSSVEASEHLSALLADVGLEHQVLSARQDREEARVVARAGEAGRITVATRMAGRGTDIRLGPGVAEEGGLAVLATELGEARRIDRQLFGRCGRQGAPGSYQQLISLEERLLENHLRGWVLGALRGGVFSRPLRILLTQIAQRAEERRSALARLRLLQSERIFEEMLAFSGRGE